MHFPSHIHRWKGTYQVMLNLSSYYIGGGVTRYDDITFSALHFLLNAISSLVLFVERAQQKPHAHYSYAYLQLHTSSSKWLPHVCMLFYFSVFVISAARLCRNCKFILVCSRGISFLVGGVRGGVLPFEFRNSWEGRSLVVESYNLPPTRSMFLHNAENMHIIWLFSD